MNRIPRSLRESYLTAGDLYRSNAVVTGDECQGPSTMSTACSRYVVVALLAAILTTGFLLRVVNLGGPDLHIDEVLHVFAARQLVQGNGPVLPSGQQYRRALLYTDMVALAGWIGGTNEWTARLPSVLFGCMTVALVFVMGRSWYSNAAGLIGASITAIAPMQIAYSREARMYATFQFFFLMFVFAFFLALEATGKRRFSNWAPPRVRDWCEAHGVWPVMFVVAAIALLVARHLHDLILIGILGPAAYVIAMAIVSLSAGATLRIRPAKYVGFALLGTICGLTYVFGTHFFDRYLVTYVPAWAAKNTSPWYYISVLSTAYPLILPALLLGAAIAITQNSKATLYVLACFGIPLVIQSVVLSWKHERYILHLTPLLFLLFAVAASSVISLVHRSLALWASSVLPTWKARAAAGLLTTVAVVFVLIFMPWFRQGISVSGGQGGRVAGLEHHHWRAATKFVLARAGSSDVMIASAPALAQYYGVELPLYYLGTDSDIHMEVGRQDAEGRAVEYIAGAPLIVDRRMLEQVTVTHRSGWIVTERFRFKGSFALPPEVREFIATHCRPQEVPDAPSMLVWRW